MSLKSLNLKILVLLIVLMVWSVHHLMKTHHTQIELPVMFSNLSDDLILSPASSDQIEIFVEGKGFHVYNLIRTNNYIEINAKNFTYGSNEVNVTEHDIVLQETVQPGTINFYLNRHINFDFDRIKRSKVKIIKRFLTLEDEMFFRQRNATISPAEVDIEGPEQIINKITNITTIPLSKNIVNDLHPVVELEIPEKVLGIKPDVVQIILEHQSYSSKTIPMINIEYPQHLGIIIIPQYATIKIEGSSENIAQIKPDMVRAYIEIEPDHNNDFAVTKFYVPDNVKLVDYTPRRVQVIRKEIDNN